MKSIIAFFLSLFSVFTPAQTSIPTPTPIPTPIVFDKLVVQNAPFTSQAPNLDWKDPRLQDGCEETSVIMAVFWSNNKSLTPTLALQEIFSLVEFQKVKYGEYRDTSLADTAVRLLSDYYQYSNYRIVENSTVSAIKDELYRGNIVILPMNGQLLGNPNYTSPGPERHMLLITGYDPKTDEFITNDSGTKNGKGYRYSPATVYNAIRDYPTGYHLPFGPVRKPMLVIGTNI